MRDYIHIEDLASAHLAALTYLERGGESTTLNVGYGSGSSVREVIDVVQRVSGVRFSVCEAPRRPGDPAMLVARAERIRQVLDWTPHYADLETIVADAWRWEQKVATNIVSIRKVSAEAGLELPRRPLVIGHHPSHRTGNLLDSGTFLSDAVLP